MCSPVDQSRQASFDSRQGSFDDSRSRQSSMDDFNRSVDSPSKGEIKLPNGNTNRSSPGPNLPKRDLLPLIKPTISVTKADSFDKAESIRHLDFDSSLGTHLASVDNLKVTIPSSDTVLMTGIPESVQVLVHKRDGSPVITEPLQSRIYYSSSEVDIVALCGEKNTAPSYIPMSSAEKSDTYSRLLDKSKPMKKRSLSDLTAGTRKELELDDPVKKKFASTEGLEPLHSAASAISKPTSKPVTINTQLLPIMVSGHSQSMVQHSTVNAQPVPLMLSHPVSLFSQSVPLLRTDSISGQSPSPAPLVKTDSLQAPSTKAQPFQQRYIPHGNMVYKRADNPAFFPVRPGLIRMKMDPKPK